MGEQKLGWNQRNMLRIRKLINGTGLTSSTSSSTCVWLLWIGRVTRRSPSPLSLGIDCLLSKSFRFGVRFTILCRPSRMSPLDAVFFGDFWRKEISILSTGQPTKFWADLYRITLTSVILQPGVDAISMKVVSAFWQLFDVLCWLIWQQANETLDAFSQKTFIPTNTVTRQ